MSASPRAHDAVGPGRPRRVRAYVGLGANVGDARATLAAAVRALEALPGTGLRGVSRLYRTRPVGVTDQPEFLNAAVAIDVPAGHDPEAGALALLAALKGLERAFGRRARRRWGPRELDLDLLVFGRHALHVPRPAASRSLDPTRSGVQWLDVPHASSRDRLFVLAPLADLAPGLRPPGWRKTVASACHEREAIEGAEAVRAMASWDRHTRDWGPLRTSRQRCGPDRGKGWDRARRRPP